MLSKGPWTKVCFFNITCHKLSKGESNSSLWFASCWQIAAVDHQDSFSGFFWEKMLRLSSTTAINLLLTRRSRCSGMSSNVSTGAQIDSTGSVARILANSCTNSLLEHCTTNSYELNTANDAEYLRENKQGFHKFQNLKGHFNCYWVNVTNL